MPIVTASGGLSRAGDEPDREVAGAPGERREEDGPARPDALAPDAAGKLEGGVAPRERREHDAELHLRQAELGHHALAGHGHVRAEQIGHEAREEDEAEDAPADPGPAGGVRDGLDVGHGRGAAYHAQTRPGQERPGT